MVSGRKRLCKACHRLTSRLWELPPMADGARYDTAWIRSALQVGALLWQSQLRCHGKVAKYCLSQTVSETVQALVSNLASSASLHASHRVHEYPVCGLARRKKDVLQADDLEVRLGEHAAHVLGPDRTRHMNPAWRNIPCHALPTKNILPQGPPPPTAAAATSAGLVMGEQPAGEAAAVRAPLQRRETQHSYGSGSAKAAQAAPGAATAATAAAAAAAAAPGLHRLCLKRSGTCGHDDAAESCDTAEAPTVLRKRQRHCGASTSTHGNDMPAAAPTPARYATAACPALGNADALVAGAAGMAPDNARAEGCNGPVAGERVDDACAHGADHA